MDTSNNESAALVSIGLPVYNGEEYLKETIESLVAQTYKHIEIIICDNASEDSTPEICTKFQATDKRIRYYRNKENIGAARNFNKTFHLARGQYFLWAAHDDIFDPRFISNAVNILDANTQIVLCYGQEVGIDEKGNIIGDRPYSLQANHGDTVKRFKDLLEKDRGSPPVFGLMRYDVAKRTSLIDSYNGSDQVFLAELILCGQFYEIPSGKFYHREHGGRSVYENPDRFSASVWFDPANKNKNIFPEWKYFLGYYRCIRNSSIGIIKKIYCSIQMTKWLKKNDFTHLKLMMHDVFVFFYKKI